MDSRYALGPNEVKQMDTTQLRDAFLIEKIFSKDEVNLTLTHYDRMIAGGAMPVSKTIDLPNPEGLRAKYLLERRELGIINIGGTGLVEVDGEKYELQYKEALYVGKGKQVIKFSSSDSNKPAKFYINSVPADMEYPTRKITLADAVVVEMGSSETSNKRTINKLIFDEVLPTCRLQMGLTELHTGSVWNSMPPHTHDRRMEVYFYFNLAEDQTLCHFMGQPQETRHIWMHNEQAVLSPIWSIPAGAGTANYSFIWGMTGENLNYTDMDGVAITDLK